MGSCDGLGMAVIVQCVLFTCICMLKDLSNRFCLHRVFSSKHCCMNGLFWESAGSLYNISQLMYRAHGDNFGCQSLSMNKGPVVFAPSDFIGAVAKSRSLIV